MARAQGERRTAPYVFKTANRDSRTVSEFNLGELGTLQAGNYNLSFDVTSIEIM